MTDTQEEVTPPAPAPKKRGAKVVRHSLRAIWLLLSLPVAIVLILALMLIDRDVTAPSWVKTRVQERAALILAGGDVAFGEITINVGRDLHPRVTLRDTVLRDAEGALLAEVDEIAGLMSPRGLIFERAARMQEVALRGVSLNLARAQDGSVALSFQGNGAALEAAPNITGLIAQSEAAFERPALEAMEQVRISDLSVTYTDARADQTWTIIDGTAMLDLRGDITAISATLPLRNGDTITDIDLAFQSPHGSPAATATASIQNIAARDLAQQSPALGWLAVVDAPLSATIATALDDSGTTLPLHASLTLDSGALRPNAQATPIRFDQAGIDLTFDPASRITKFTALNLTSERGTFTGDGQAIPQAFEDGLPKTFVGQFNFSDISFHPPNLYEAPLDIAAANIDLRLSLDPFRVDIGQAVVTDPKLSLIAKGAAWAGDGGWSTRLDLTADSFGTDSLAAFWPPPASPRARDWFLNNVTGATFSDATFGLRTQPGLPPVIAAGFGFSDAKVTFMKTMPPVNAAQGFVSIAHREMAVSIDAGQVSAPTGGQVDIAGSSLIIAELGKRDTRMVLALESRSAITAALSLLDQEPMRVMSKANRPVTLADGRARLSGEISFPLGRRPAPGELQFDVKGVLSRLRSDQIVPDRTLAASAITVRATNTELLFEGDITLDGVPLRGRYSTGIGADADGRGEIAAQITLSPEALDAFDVKLPPGFVAGRARGELSVALARGKPAAFEIASNLQGVTLALPPIGWSKGAQADGRLLVSGTLGAVPNITRLEVGGGGLTARGAIDFNADGSLNRARFSTVRLGNWLDAPITLRGRGAGRPVGVEIAGGAIDLRRARFGAGGQDSGPLSIALDQLLITEGIALSDFRGNFDGTGGFSGQFQGRVNGAALIQGTVAPRNGRSAVRLVTDDAGGVVRAAGFLNNAVGGTLDLTLLPSGGAGTFDGALAVRDLRVKDAPAMAALLDAISVVGLLQQLDGQGLAFDAVDATFRLTPDQVIVTQSSATGPGLGISLDGIYALATKSVDFQGVISPFYILNQIGSVLTRPGEGLIGFNFNIRGTAANPSVSVNPLSALTPGMFREIFRRAPPEVSQ